MAKPIKLGLVSEGEDADRFSDYHEHPPELPPNGKELMERVKKKAKANGLL
jgi:hypothetical protein